MKTGSTGNTEILAVRNRRSLSLSLSRSLSLWLAPRAPRAPRAPLAPLASAALLAALLTALPAAAQVPEVNPASRRDPAAAAVLFQEGRVAAKGGDYATACLKFGESYRFDPAVGTLLNIADCSERRGLLAAAWQAFSQAAEQLPKEDRRRQVAEGRAAALAPRLPRLSVTLAPGAPAGTKVLRDDVELGSGSLGTALPLDPGEHAVVVKAPGREDRRYAVSALEGQPLSLVVEPGPALPQAEAPPVAQPEPRPVSPEKPREAGGLGAMRVAGIVVGGVGIVSIGAAIATGLMLPGKQRVVDEHCDTNRFCDAEGYEAAQSGQTLSTVNTITWIAGGVAVGAGATLFLLGGPGREDEPSTALEVRPLPGGASASLRGRF